MKAVVMKSLGSAADVLSFQDVEDPQIKTPTEILIRLKAAGINPIDTKICHRGTFYPDQMPAILGCDGAGIVEAIGSAVTDFKPGDEVYFSAGGLGKSQTGNYAQLAVVESHRIAHKPKSISFAEAAAAPLVLITAWESLFDRGRLEAQYKVLVHGGTGGVGHVAVQLAKLGGAQVCTTVGSPDKARLARQLGADETILYQQSDVVQKVLDWTDGQGVDLAFDTVGGKTFFETCEAVKIYGDIVTILQPDPALGDLKVARDRNLRIGLELMLIPGLKGLTEAEKHQAQILQQCATWIDEGKLTIHLCQTFPLAEAAKAHEQLRKGAITGKVVLIVDSE